MKKHYFVCYDGGTNGNFVATLIRTMADATYYENFGRFTSNGSCDHMSGGMRLSYDYAFSRFGRSIYPESNENLNILTDALDNPKDTYEKFILPHERNFDFDISTLHYIRPYSINKFLEYNIKVVYITYTLQDLNLIAHNFIYKFIEKEREGEIDKFNFFKQILATAHLFESLRELERSMQEKISLSDLSKSILDDLIVAYIEVLTVKNSFKDYDLIKNNDPTKFIELPFRLMYSDAGKTLELLKNFTNMEINDSTRILYRDYMYAQEPILNRIKNS
jgi:hypothetical protein